MKLLIAALAAGLALAATAAQAAPTQHQIELSRRFMTDIHIVDTMDSMVKAMRPMMMQQAGANLSPDQTKLFDAAMDASVKRFLADYMARVEVIYADIFSEEELTQLVVFYESAAGKSMIAKTPLVQAKVVPLVNEMMPGFQADLMNELCSRLGCDARAPAKHSEASGVAIPG